MSLGIPAQAKVKGVSIAVKAIAATFSLCLFTLGAAQLVTVKRTPKPGDVLRYKVSIIFTLYGNDIVYQSVLTEKVIDVAKDGSYTMQSSQTDASANNGRDVPIISNPTVSQTTYDARGNILELPRDYSWRDAYLGSVVLPDKPVKPGDTYTIQFPARADRSSEAASVTYTIETAPGEKIDGFHTLVMHEKYAETTGTYPATSEGRIWLNPADGTLVKLDENWRNAPLLGTHTIVNAHVSYERISD